MNRFEHFPIGFFSAIMGLAGFSIASSKCATFFAPLFWVADVSFFLALFLFFLFLTAYSIKIFRFPNAVKAEFLHPIFANFFPALPMAMLLLSLPLLHFFPFASFVFWAIGTLVQFLLTISIFSRWIHSDVFKTHHLTPVWFLPLVGNLLIPITGTAHADAEFLWFFFSFGTIFWIVITTLFLNRIFFHDPLPDRLSPTFFILLAPPSLVVLSFFALGGGAEIFPKMVYFFGLFILFFLLAQGKKAIPSQFFVSWWAYSFPLAAFTSASFVMYSVFLHPLYFFIAVFCYSLLSIIILILLWKTAKAVKNKEICTAH